MDLFFIVLLIILAFSCVLINWKSFVLIIISDRKTKTGFFRKNKIGKHAGKQCNFHLKYKDFFCYSSDYLPVKQGRGSGSKLHLVNGLFGVKLNKLHKVYI